MYHILIEKKSRKIIIIQWRQYKPNYKNRLRHPDPYRKNLF